MILGAIASATKEHAACVMYKFGSSTLGSMVALSSIFSAIAFDLAMGQSAIPLEQAGFTLVGVSIAFYLYSLLSQNRQEVLAEPEPL